MDRRSDKLKKYMTKKKKFNCDYNNQAWSKLTKKQILSNEYVEQD